MVKRRNEEGLDGIEFWGKVKGTDNDYLVCVGYSNSVDYPNKKFYFWCVAQAIDRCSPDIAGPRCTARAARARPTCAGPPRTLSQERSFVRTMGLGWTQCPASCPVGPGMPWRLC